MKTLGFGKKVYLWALAALGVAAAVMVVLLVVRTAGANSPAGPVRVPRIAVIGDSFSAGQNNEVNWPSLWAAGSKYAIANVSRAGAGYVGGRHESGSFSEQVKDALAVKPDLIVVFGGINDIDKRADAVTQAAKDLFTELAQSAPDSRLVVLGPIWHTEVPPEVAVSISDSIDAAARSTGTSFVELINENWLVGDGLTQEDNIHPTDEGQRVLSRQLPPVIRPYMAVGDR